MTMKAFKKLTKNTVNIAVSGTEYFTCPMLPVGELPAFKEGMAALLSEDMPAQLEGRRKLLALIEKVFPLEFKDKLYRLLPADILAVASILMFGDENDEPEEGKKKLEVSFPAPPESSTASSPSSASCGNTAGGSRRSWLSLILSSWPFKRGSAEAGPTQP